MTTRFFVSPDQIQDNRAHLDAGDAHHLHTVLRARTGDRISVLDGSGKEYPAVLERVAKNGATARLGAPAQPDTEPRTRITVAQALPKTAEKMEQVLQRGTEIGAAAFWGFASARSLPHLKGERAAKRLDRWAAIVKTAAEQAQRTRLPLVRADGALSEVLFGAKDYDLALLADTGPGHRTLRDILAGSIPAPRSLLVVVGPEGGWAEEEATAAAAAGVRSVSLGPRVLRTETASLVLLAQILFALEPGA